MSRTAAPRSFKHRLEAFVTAMTKLGLAPGNGLRTYEQYYDAVEGLPSPLLSVSELRQEAASSSTSRRRSNRCESSGHVTPCTCRRARFTAATVASNELLGSVVLGAGKTRPHRQLAPHNTLLMGIMLCTVADPALPYAKPTSCISILLYCITLCSALTCC